MPNKNQLHTKVVRCSNSQKQSMIPLPVRDNVRNSKVKLSLISETSQSSAKIMDRDIKKIDSVIHRKEQPIVPINLKISKEVTITSITHVNDTENNIISKLKKLPGITINLIKSEPVFKVPESPKLKTNSYKKTKTTHNKLKVFEKKGLSVRRENNIGSSITTGSDKDILKNSEASLKKYPISEKEKENLQRTSSPKKLSTKTQSSSIIKSKSLKTLKQVEKVSNNCNVISKKWKTISDQDTIINNTELNTNNLANENYMLMDLSTDGQFNIVPARFPLDFINVSATEYDNFLMGINKSSKNNTIHLETSHKDTEKKSLVIQEQLNSFSDFLGCVNTSLNINESNDIHPELPYQYFNNGNLCLDNIKDEQLHLNNKSKENTIGKFEDETTYNSNFYLYDHTSKHNMNQMMDTSIIQRDNQLLQKMTNYYCDDLENISKNENKLMDFNKPIQEILPNNTKSSLNLKSDKYGNGIKRKQSQNEF